MRSTTTRFVAALALALSMGAATARAADVIDHSNSGSSATGSPFAADIATSREGVGASPMDDSRSASAVGEPRAYGTPTSRPGYGATPADTSNSASALGGFGTGPVRGAATLASLTR